MIGGMAPSYYFAGAADGKVCVFAAEATMALRTHKGDASAVRVLAWSKDGKLAAGGQEALVRIWGTEPTKPIRTLENPGSVESLAFSPNGKWLAVGASEDRVRIFSYPGGKLAHEFTSPGSPPAVSALAWAADSNQLNAGRAEGTDWGAFAKGLTRCARDSCPLKLTLSRWRRSCHRRRKSNSSTITLCPMPKIPRLPRRWT